MALKIATKVAKSMKRLTAEARRAQSWKNSNFEIRISKFYSVDSVSLCGEIRLALLRCGYS
jgi:hypothetical protein